MNQKYFILTYGCQMNKADSERIAGKLESDGFVKAKNSGEADFIVLNSCVVRQAAEDSVFGFAKKAQALREIKPDIKIVVTGCLVGVESDRPKRISLPQLRKKLPWVNDFWPIGKVGLEVSPKREAKKNALVPISSGCNNFCTYCVVPYTRGQEKSRCPEEIICEIETLVKNGAEEVLLLGQNVNSYGKDLKPPKSFAELLEAVHSIGKIKKIKFLTAHPKDMSDKLIKTIAELPKIDRYLHFPIQAGDDEILKRMNRGYTVSDYKKLVYKIRQKIPKVEIGTDIIVGFPGETREQFENTVKVIKEIKFDNAFIAMYSPRQGTPAANFADDVPQTEKRRRHKILLELLRKQKLK